LIENISDFSSLFIFNYDWIYHGTYLQIKLKLTHKICDACISYLITKM